MPRCSARRSAVRQSQRPGDRLRPAGQFDRIRLAPRTIHIAARVAYAQASSAWGRAARAAHAPAPRRCRPARGSVSTAKGQPAERVALAQQIAHFAPQGERLLASVRSLLPAVHSDASYAKPSYRPATGAGPAHL